MNRQLMNARGNNKPTPIVLDSFTATKFNMGQDQDLYEERSLMARNDIWHKIDVKRGGLYDKETILRTIIKAVYPADLVPVMYKSVGHDCNFLVRNCDRALDQLCKTNLIVHGTDNKPLVLTITLGYASIHELKINIQPILLTVLKKRHDFRKKSLVLDKFHYDSDIYDIVYCPLSQIRTFTHVMKLVKSASTSFENMSLQQNELTELTPFEIVNLSNVKYLDLRYNELLKVDTLIVLKSMNVIELWLDGNPLCENYSSPKQYIESVRQFCPRLRKLDGMYVGSQDLPLHFPVYTKSWKTNKLTSQFIHHFFTLYDQKDKNILRGLYASDGWHSITVSTLTTPTSKKHLQGFISENRNLVLFAKNSQHLYHGEDDIIDILNKFPQTYHNQNTFSYDLMYECDTYLMISVEGLFKLSTSNKQIYAFSRTFVLSVEEDNEYKIMNDQHHIYAPLHAVHSFAYERLEAEGPPDIKDFGISSQERENTLKHFENTTTMNTMYSEKFLDDSEWDMRRALREFMICYKKQTIPYEAFIKH